MSEPAHASPAAASRGGITHPDGYSPADDPSHLVGREDQPDTEPTAGPQLVQPTAGDEVIYYCNRGALPAVLQHVASGAGGTVSAGMVLLEAGPHPVFVNGTYDAAAKCELGTFHYAHQAWRRTGASATSREQAAQLPLGGGILTVVLARELGLGGAAGSEAARPADGPAVEATGGFSMPEVVAGDRVEYVTGDGHRVAYVTGGIDCERSVVDLHVDLPTGGITVHQAKYDPARTAGTWHIEGRVDASTTSACGEATEETRAYSRVYPADQAAENSFEGLGLGSRRQSGAGTSGHGDTCATTAASPLSLGDMVRDAIRWDRDRIERTLRDVERKAELAGTLDALNLTPAAVRVLRDAVRGSL